LHNGPGVPAPGLSFEDCDPEYVPAPDQEFWRDDRLIGYRARYEFVSTEDLSALESLLLRSVFILSFATFFRKKWRKKPGLRKNCLKRGPHSLKG